MTIIDHGHDDALEFALDDADRAIADACRHAIAEQRYYLNTRDKLQQQRAQERETRRLP